MNSNLFSSGVIKEHYDPFRNMVDVEAIEQIPLEERVKRCDFALNLLDGCRDDPTRIKGKSLSDPGGEPFSGVELMRLYPIPPTPGRPDRTPWHPNCPN